ncbi:MAG: cobalamin-dependent protein, partial [Actinomycetota bacterium]
LRRRGWEGSDLGADVPIESLLFALGDVADVKAVGLSVTHPSHLSSLEASCAAVRDARPDVRIVVGGGAIDDEEHAVELGADGYAASGGDMHELLDEWFPVGRAVRGPVAGGS